jgi:cyclase
VRVIPCLDVQDGRVVKGVNFANLRDAGDPAELAGHYVGEGADELTFLDISATTEGRQTTIDMVRRVVREVSIPLTVGGGIASVDDAERLLDAGADKVSINTAAIQRPGLISDIAQRFGSRKLVLAVDASHQPGRRSGFGVVTHGGGVSADLDAVEWAHRGADLGAGEILLTSLDADGTNQGFDLELIRAVRAAADVGLIASGGAGRVADFPAAVEAGADAVLAAGVFHFGTVSVAQVKQALTEAGYRVR